MTLPVNLRQEMRDRLAQMLGSAYDHLVVEAILDQMGEATSKWLISRARDEVFDSQGERSLRRAADAVGAER